MTARKKTQTAATDAYVEQAWQKLDIHGAHDDLEWAAAEGEDPEEWECVVCGKSFRSEAAWDSHERSKKHMKEVERLRQEMQDENDELGLQPDSEQEEEFPTQLNESRPTSPTSVVAELSTSDLQLPSGEADNPNPDRDEDNIYPAEESIPRSKQKKKKITKVSSAAEPLTKTEKMSREIPDPSAFLHPKARMQRPFQPTDHRDVSRPSSTVDSNSQNGGDHDGTAEVLSDQKTSDLFKGAATGEPELSKRDKRRARQAKKVMIGKTAETQVRT